MKKTLAILLALAMVFSTLTVSFAEGSLGADAQACVTLGMLKGDTSAGVTADYVAQAPTRLTAAILFLRLKGLENEALAYTGTDNFADVNLVNWAGGKAILGYLKTHPELGWVGDQGKFAPNDKITAQAYYKVMLETLGYKQSTASIVGDFPFDKTVEFAATKGLTKVAAVTNFTVNDVAIATVEALKATVKDSTKTLVAALIDAKAITNEAAVAAGVVTNVVLAVDSVVAKSASSFVVTFNTAVADTTKATISVKRNNVVVPLTTTWNEGKTEATLTYAGLLPEGDFVTAVKVDDKDLGSKTVTITKQKIAKIEVLGDALSVAPPTTTGTGSSAVTKPGKGFASYKVYDQYGVDITNNPMSNSGIGFNTSVGTGSGKNGLLTVTSFNDNVFLTQFPTATVTAYCTDSAVSTTKSLTVSLSQGTLGDITLNKVTNVDNKEIKSNDQISKFYIDFTATDINGNPTKNFTLVTGGLIYSNPSTKLLMTSNPTLLDARVTNDPADSNKAVIELVVNNGAIYQDTKVIITAMTKNGKSSSITVDVKKPSSLDSLTLMTPSVLVAAGDTDVVIPYEAYDQNGNALTKYDDIVYQENGINSFTAYGDLKFSKNADGTLKITAGKTTTSPAYTTFVKGVPTVFQVVTRAGKSSMITIRPDEAAVANDLRIDTSVVKQYMQKDAIQYMDAGAYYGGFEVLDQYGRVMNIASDATSPYWIQASVPSSSIISITTPGKAFLGNRVTMTATGLGTETVQFDLMKTGSSTPIATKSAVFAVVKDTDIVGIKLSAISTMYATAGATTGIASQDTAQVTEYDKAITVNGKLRNEGTVKLATRTSGLIQRFVDSSWFIVDGTYLRAKKLPTNMTEATGKVTATVPLNGTLYTATTDVKSSSVAPVATAVDVDVTVASVKVESGSAPTGFTVDGDTITATVTAMNSLTSNSILSYDNTGAGTNGDLGFYVEDSYGTWGLPVAYVTILSQRNVNPTTGVVSNITNYGYDASTNMLTITGGTAVQGDEVVISVVANNGISKTFKFVVK